MRIVAYTDRLSVAPGERIRFMVSSSPERYRASYRRLTGRWSPPEPPKVATAAELAEETEYPGRVQRLRPGSYAIAEDSPGLALDRFTLQAWIYPTLLDRGLQGILSRWHADRHCGYGLFLERGGDLSLRLDNTTIRTGVPLRPFRWYLVSASYDPVERCARVIQRPRDKSFSDPDGADVAAAAEPPSIEACPLLIGGFMATDGPVASFNGKLASPRIADSTVGPEPPESLIADSLIASWDFSRDVREPWVRDVSGNGLDLRLVNAPARAVTGWNWAGREVDHRNVPEEYGAIFFHDDDLEDAGWQPDFELAVPEDLPSGVYAAHLQADGAEDYVPFFVRPPRGHATAELALLLPTVSYIAYGNEHVALTNPVAVVEHSLWDYMDPADHLALSVPLLSLYERHRDGTGNFHASRLRPLATMRPTYRHPLLRAPHQFPADLDLIEWLETKRFRYDVITDEDLHTDGVELLKRYRAVLTGSHPEYWTTSMLDALEDYLVAAGRLIYLGGNGFYWVTAIDSSRPHLIEVRRGRRGTGTWRSAPGEDFHATTGEPGGLWRDRGRPPQRLVGVGMAAQGFDRSVAYRREAGSADERAAWIFDGVPEGPIGEVGSVLGGAAGLEIDRLDFELGTPEHALLLASARGFSDSYQHAVEEVESSDSKQGGSVSPFVHADMVFFETPSGGAVFSVGSIAWCGALSHGRCDNSVSRVTENVVRRFLTSENFSP